MSRLAARSIFRSPAPTMQHLPQPRATRAAWLVMPPRAVRMPSAARMPSTSSGLVSSRTRMTVSPFLAAATASAEVKTILPHAPPGPAGRPDRNASAFFSAAGSMIGCSSSSSWAGCDARHGRLLVDQPLVEHVHRHVQGGGAGPLAVAALEHVELAFLDRELDVLHVVVVLFQLACGCRRAACTARAISVSSDGRCWFCGFLVASFSGLGVRMPATTSSPWALTSHSP